MSNQIKNVRYPEMPPQRRRENLVRNTTEDIYLVILDIYDKMKFLIAINAILAILIIVSALYVFTL